MKNTLLLIISSFFFYNTTVAQVVNEDVNFDFYQSPSNNDFVNYFGNGIGILPSATGGITGGSLIMPDSINWGNDNAIYCTYYKPVASDTMITSICFLYDSAAVHPASFQRPVSIFLHPWADFNHYIIGSVTLNKKIEILSYGWTNTQVNVNLLNNHWYQLVLSVVGYPATLSVAVKAEVFDLGTTGQSAPVSLNSSAGAFAENILPVDTAIRVSFSGAKIGGALLTDNFHFHGGKGSSTCPSTTGIHDATAITSVKWYPVPASSMLHVSGMTNETRLTIFNPEGKIVLDQLLYVSESDLDVSSLAEGLYFVRLISGNSTTTGKITISR